MRDGNDVVLRHEWMDVRRIIHMNMKEHPKDGPRSSLGHSIGHFEGDTLVIETANYSAGVLNQYVEQPGQPTRGAAALGRADYGRAPPSRRGASAAGRRDRSVRSGVLQAAVPALDDEVRAVGSEARAVQLLARRPDRHHQEIVRLMDDRFQRLRSAGLRRRCCTLSHHSLKNCALRWQSDSHRRSWRRSSSGSGRQAYTVTDRDIDALRSPFTEDQLFGIILGAAFGAAGAASALACGPWRRLEAAQGRARRRPLVAIAVRVHSPVCGLAAGCRPDAALPPCYLARLTRCTRRR